MPRPLLQTLLVLAAALPSLADPSPVEPWRGTWVRVDHARDDTARHAAIDRVTEPMSLVLRGFARAVMRQRMQPVDRYVIEQDGGVAVIRSNIGEEYPLDGRPRGGAEADRVVSRIDEEGRIHQSWRLGADSHGTTHWRLEPSGERLTVLERVHDPHFYEPIEFSTTYARVDADE